MSPLKKFFGSRVLGAAAAVALAIALPHAANATDLTDPITGATNWVAALKTFLTNAVPVAGGVIFILGLLGIRKHHKNPQQNPIGAAIAEVIVGGCLLVWVTLSAMTAHQIANSQTDTVTQQTLGGS